MTLSKIAAKPCRMLWCRAAIRECVAALGRAHDTIPVWTGAVPAARCIKWHQLTPGKAMGLRSGWSADAQGSCGLAQRMACYILCASHVHALLHPLHVNVHPCTLSIPGTGSEVLMSHGPLLMGVWPGPEK
eukprot:scaffold21108_cov22-Tisochrysis_lutea.AAC.1